MKKLTILTVLLSAFFISSCGGKVAKSTPEESSQSFMQCLYETDSECVLSLIKLEGTAKNHPEKIKELVDALGKAANEDARAKGGVASIEVGAASYSIDRTTASVPVETTFKNTNEEKVSSTLILLAGEGDDHSWYVKFN